MRHQAMMEQALAALDLDGLRAGVKEGLVLDAEKEALLVLWVPVLLVVVLPPVGAGNHPHAAVVDRGVVEREPAAGDRVLLIDPEIVVILVPVHIPARVRRLVEAL